MIVSTLIAASAAAQPALAPQPKSAPALTAEKSMSCCEKMAKGEGCACCKEMGKNAHGEHGMTHGADGAGEHTN
jgi:hypothetical protein